MAKKIIISFSQQPLPGNGFSYQISIDGYSLFFNNGQDLLKVNYVPNGSPLTDEFDVERGVDLEETIDRTVDFLSLKYQHSTISYSVVGNTIEVFINFNEYISVIFGVSNIYITTTSVTPSNSENINLKYYFQYINDANDEYICQLYKKGYTGDSLEISGKAIIEKGSVKNHLEPIRGTGLSLELEASIDLSFEDLYTENERDFTVKLKKNNKVIFRGYLDPEGIYQSFVRDTWVLNLNCVDGLGSLANLSFVDDNGYHIVGKKSAIDIIYYCLKRTGILLPINTCINTYYTGLTPSDNLDILTQIKLNTDRFVRADEDTIMSCEEVLKSILDLFRACITQENAEWYIYKPNEFYDNQYPVFRRYNTNNTYIGTSIINLNSVLGSQINGFYPHHCSADQKIEIKGAISSFRINYKYGYVVGLFPNPKLEHTAGSLVYEGWTILDPFYLINDPTSSSGFIFKDGLSGDTSLAVISDPLAVTTEDLLSLKISSVATLFNGLYGSRFIKMKIQLGSYYLKYVVKNNETDIADASTLSEWTTNSSDFFYICVHGSSEIVIDFPKLPADGNITIGIIETLPLLTDGGQTVFNEINLVPTTNASSAVGEFHTLSRSSNISSKIEENKLIYNGDNSGIVYLGAVFKNNGLTPTSSWFRKGRSESFPILRIAAEEGLKLSQKPTKIFTGSIYGLMNYMSVAEIDNINGKFCPIEYEFDTFRNTCKIKYLELFSGEISNLLYNFTPDYGNTVKPTIK